MATTFWIVILVLAVLLATTTATWLGSPALSRQQRSWIRRVIGFPFTVVLMLVLAVCGRATSERTVRKLAGSPEALKARQEAELASRDVIAVWAAETPLRLGLVLLEDVCVGGSATELFLPTGSDRYKIKYMMSVAAYFGADPRRMADTIDGVLSAGDRTGLRVPFNHEFHYARTVVEYYRGKTGDPQGPGTGEPTRLSRGTILTFSWDQVRSGNTGQLIEEPGPCSPHEPPVRRCLNEPASTSVADLRREHGMVFRITMPVRNYFTVWK
ncbi:hypothetical protein OG890_22180 [Streptomyces anulatus]|uniref:hypothetical protein n=1 Tax=Streptomyces anulatus TaxID=1892 RepID=UPI0022554A19|nr:hypothetical protein [Streptomyces anulatus]MCX4486611.1 hypothetical protein [Streptomyces anulatus]